MSKSEVIPNNRTPVAGWIGGFSTSKAAFSYPSPDLSSLPLLGNMDNINWLRRQVNVLWPEFSWETVIGEPKSRCYQMFAPDISRGGYDDAGRFWSIICPQQGAYSPVLGSLNIEVTVTGQRGWMNESAPERDVDLLAADMNVTGQVWFGPGSRDKSAYKLLESLFKQEGLPFPLNKENAIQIELHKVGDPDTPTIAVRSGLDQSYPNPAFALHYDEAWAVANVAVAIGPIRSRNSVLVDEFNAIVMRIFNDASGAILQQGNVLTWNVWFDAPTLVDCAEWKGHAKKWRESIDTGHGSPDGPGTVPKFFDGRPYVPSVEAANSDRKALNTWLQDRFGIELPSS